MVANKQKDYMVCKLENDAIFQRGADLPVVLFPVFEAESPWQRSQAVKVVH